MKKIYIVGDSISMQYGPYLQAYLAGKMAYSRKEGEEEALLNLDKPAGANGGDSSMVLGFLTGMANAGAIQADLLLVNCGLHDIKVDAASGKHQIPIDQYEENLRGIIGVASRLGTCLAWIRTTPCDEAVHNKPGMGFHRFSADCIAYNEVADRVMAAAGIPSIDLFSFTANLGPGLYCDHVHFLEPIREKQAAYIAGWLEGWEADSRERLSEGPHGRRYLPL